MTSQVNLQEAGPTGIVDLFMVYQFLRRLATPYDKWPAFKEGVIDKDGKILVKKNRRNPAQKKSFGVFDVMIMKLKNLLGKVPGGKTRLATYAAALYLIKEGQNTTKTEEEVLEENTDLMYLDYVNEFRKLYEDMPTNNAGGGNIAGMGVGGADDVKVSKKKAKSYKDKNKEAAADFHNALRTSIHAKYNVKEDLSHYPVQDLHVKLSDYPDDKFDTDKDNKPDSWVTGDPANPIEFLPTGSKMQNPPDIKKILDKANKEIEKQRGRKLKPITV